MKNSQRGIGFGNAYNLEHCLSLLVKATDILLHRKDYDGHGWEEIEYAWRESKKYIEYWEQYADEYKENAELKAEVERLNYQTELRARLITKIREDCENEYLGKVAAENKTLEILREIKAKCFPDTGTQDLHIEFESVEEIFAKHGIELEEGE